MSTSELLSRCFSLKGKTALVTGGATGIGRMVAHALAGAGARVLIVSRKTDICARTAEDLNALDLAGEVEGFAGDVGSEDGISKLVAAVQLRTQKLDILVNNAGQAWGAPFEEFPYKAWGQILSVNVVGPFHLTQRLLSLLQRAATASDPARVVNIGSVMGEVPMGDGAYSYAASKSAIHHITRILAKELAPDAITVNALAPGPFVSKMTAFATQDAAGREKVGKGVPLGRMGQEEDIAGCMLFLCGGGGGYVTGAVLPVSGGINVSTGPAIFETEI